MADPIPTIAQTLDGLLAGDYTREQAAVWIGRHIEAAADVAAEEAYDRDSFAALAMQPLLSDRRFMQEARNAGQDPHEAVAATAYGVADAMKKLRSA